MVGLAPIIDQGNPVNASHPLNRGRVAWWLAAPQLNGSGYGSPTWRDLLGRNPGTLTNGPLWRGAGRPGGCGSIRMPTVDGAKVEDAVASGLPAASTFSFAVWVAVRSYTNLACVCNYGQQTRTALTGRRRGILQFNNEIYFWGESADWSTGTAWDTTGKFHRLLFASDGTTISFYYDGLLANSAVVPAGLTALQAADTYLTVGDRHPSGTTSPDMDADDYTIWSRALSASEVWADYDLSRRGYPGVLNTLPATRAFAAAGAADTGVWLWRA